MGWDARKKILAVWSGFAPAAGFAVMSGDTLTTSYQDAEEALSRAKLTAERTERVGAHVLGTLGDQRQQLLGAADGAAA